MTVSSLSQQRVSNWEAFCEWVTSASNCLHVGGSCADDPYASAATICFIIAFVGAPPVDIDGIQPVAGRRMQPHHLRAVVRAIGLPSILSGKQQP